MPAHSVSARKRKEYKSFPSSVGRTQAERKIHAMLRRYLECDLARFYDKNTIVLAQEITLGI